MKPPRLVLSVILIVGALSVGWFALSHSPTPKCPDDFDTPEEEIAAFNEWLISFTKENPNATNADVSAARVEFFIEHDCEAALRRIADFYTGNIDEETRTLIEQSGGQVSM